MFRRPCGPALVALLALVLAAATARGQGDSEGRAGPAEPAEGERGPLQLSWEVAAGCPGRDAMTAQIRELVGEQAWERAEPPITAHVQVRRTAGGWRLELRTEQGESSGQRTLKGDSCEEVVDAAALVVALSIDPEAVRRSRPEPPASPQSGPGDASEKQAGSDDAPADLTAPEPRSRSGQDGGQPEPGAAEATEPVEQGGAAEPAGANESGERSQASESPWGGTVTAEAIGDVGVLPGPAVGAAAGVALGWRWLQAELGALVLAPRSQGLGGPPPPPGAASDARAEVLLAAGYARGCGAWQLGDWALGPCVAAEAGAVRGESFGVTEPGSGRAAWFALRGGAQLRWAPARWLRVRLRASMGVPLTRPRLLIEGIGPVHRPAAVFGRGGIGAEVHFP